jgi:hypothetical protein
MVGEDRDQLLLVFGLQEVLEGIRRELGKGCVSWGKDGERSFPFQGADESCSVERRRECLELTSSRRRIDEVLLGRMSIYAAQGKAEGQCGNHKIDTD